MDYFFYDLCFATLICMHFLNHCLGGFGCTKYLWVYWLLLISFDSSRFEKCGSSCFSRLIAKPDVLNAFKWRSVSLNQSWMHHIWGWNQCLLSLYWKFRLQPVYSHFILHYCHWYLEGQFTQKWTSWGWVNGCFFHFWVNCSFEYDLQSCKILNNLMVVNRLQSKHYCNWYLKG